jgi:hypothetical protein
LLGCAGSVEHDAPASDSPLRGNGPSADADGAPGATAPSSGSATDGLLDVTTAAGVASFFGTVHGVVEDARGLVLAGADEDSLHPETMLARKLSFVIPAGAGYTLRLNALSTGDAPTACHAVVGPLSVAAGAVANVQVFAWDCGGVTGFVPRSVASDCYWLTDWAFVTRTSVAVGSDVDVTVAVAARASLTWSTPSPAVGAFADARAAHTSFRCQTASESVRLSLAVDAAGCREELSQTVACSEPAPK